MRTHHNLVMELEKRKRQSSKIILVEVNVNLWKNLENKKLRLKIFLAAH